MKKPILIAILSSILILVGSYYYFYILNPLVEEPKLPKKQRIIIQKPVTSIQSKVVVKAELKTDKKKEETKSREQKEGDLKHSEKTKEKIKQREQKEIKQDEKVKKEVVSKPKKQPRFYSLIYVASSRREAEKIKDDVYGKGYHTAKAGKHGKNDAVIISPFTDKWEAEYVLKHLIEDTGIKSFKIVAVY